MNEFYPDEVAPQLFECFIARAQTGLPEDYLSSAKGVVVAGPDLLRGVSGVSKSGYSNWIASWGGAVFERDLPEENGCLRVNQLGEFWYIQRIVIGRYNREEFQGLVLAFEHAPICTNTYQEAMRLAEHCHPVPRPPMAGCWVEVR
jgi:hypothetical protein